MSTPIWLEDDGTLRDFSRAPYWIEEDYKQWARGEHHAHLDQYYSIIGMQKFHEYHWQRSCRQSQLAEAAADHQALLSVLPDHLQKPVILPAHREDAKPRHFRRDLLRDEAYLYRNRSAQR